VLSKQQSESIIVLLYQNNWFTLPNGHRNQLGFGHGALGANGQT
jgi:hypothetical protein